MSFQPVRPRSQQDLINSQHIPSPTTSEVFNASWELGARDRELNAIARMKALSDLKLTGEKVGANVLNEKYPGLDKPFKEPMTMQAAQFIFDETQERRKHERVLGRASGFMKGTVLPFVTGAASAMADPIGFGVGVALGGITKLAFSARLAKFSKAKKFGIDVVENMVANTASEVVVYKANQGELQDYTARQALTNVVAASTLLPGIAHAGSAGMKAFSNFGVKSIDGAHRVSDLAINEGKELSEIIDPLADGMNQDIAIKPEFADAVDTTFGELSPKVMEGADNIGDALKNMVKLSEEGEISPDMLQKFADVAEESGVDSRYLTLMDDSELTELSPKVLADLENNLKSERSDFGYNKEAEELLNNPPKIQENFNQETLPDFETRLAQLKESELDAGQASEIAEIDSIRQDRQITEEYMNCLGITL